MTTRLRPYSLTRVLALFPTRESDSRFYHLLEQLPAAFLALQQTCNILGVNGKAAALTEWTRDELATLLLDEILATTQPSELRAMLDLMEPGDTRQIKDAVMRRRSGGVVEVDLRLTAYDENGTTTVLVTATPAEERQSMERRSQQHILALEAINGLFELLGQPGQASLEQGLDLIWKTFQPDVLGYYRLETSATQLRLQHLSGHGTDLPAVVEAADAPNLMKPSRWHSGQPTETRLMRTLRAAGWNHFFGHPVGGASETVGLLFAAYRAGSLPFPQAPAALALGARVISFLVASASQHSSLAETRARTLHLTSRLNAIQAAIEESVLLLNAGGIIEDANSAAAKMFGFRPEDMVGRTLDDVTGADEDFTRALARGIRGDGPRDLSGTLHRRSGEAFPVAATSLPLPGGDCLLMLWDQSDSRADQIRQEHLDHLAYVGQSTQSFAHEVRAPLNNISMGVQLIASRMPADDPQQHTLAKIETECQRLSDLMKDMLAWAKPIEPKLVPTDVTALLQRLVSRWTSKIKRQNVRLIVSVADDAPPIAAEPPLLERVFVNLIENALQAMPTGGHLSLAIQTLDRGAHGRFVEVRVGNSGPGIPEEVRRRMFDPYFTTKVHGTGLGLAICKRLVTVHHGAINVESYPDAGTIFILTFPACPPDEGPAQEATA